MPPAAAIDEPRQVQAEILADRDARRRRHRRVADLRGERGIGGEPRACAALQRRQRSAARRFGMPSSVTSLTTVSGSPTLTVRAFTSWMCTDRRLVGAHLRAAGAGAERAGLRRLHHVVDEVVGPQRGVGLFGLAVRRQRPDQLSLSLKPFGTLHPEHEAVAARQEVRRLALIGAADVEAVVGADRHVDLFFPVAVHVAEQEVLRAVGACSQPS